MTIVSICIFWTCVFLVIYAYGLYPYLLRLVAKLLKKNYQRNTAFQPKVTIIIPAYNEEKVIHQKIENCLSLDYPKDLLEIMVCSDCSSDATAQIVLQSIDKGITFYDYRERSGKTGVLNKSVEKARGDIVVFTDANTMFRKDAVSAMVSMFVSEDVGAVAGQVQLITPNQSSGVEKELVYRNFESDLKYYEGLFGKTIGAFGGFYSLRKKLFEKLPANAYSNDDFLITMRILMRGYKVLFDNSALSYEETALTVREEFQRRIRIGAGNFQSFVMMKSMLNPKHGLTTLFYVSHKVLRWFSPFFFVTLILINILLVPLPLYTALLYGQMVMYALFLAGLFLSLCNIKVPLLSSLFHFFSMNVALLLGFIRYVRGIKSATWESTERTLV